MSVSSREEREKLEKSENLMLGGAVGAPAPRGRKHVRNVNSDVPATYYSEWSHLEAMIWFIFF